MLKVITIGLKMSLNLLFQSKNQLRFQKSTNYKRVFLMSNASPLVKKTDHRYSVSIDRLTILRYLKNVKITKIAVTKIYIIDAIYKFPAKTRYCTMRMTTTDINGS